MRFPNQLLSISFVFAVLSCVGEEGAPPEPDLTEVSVGIIPIAEVAPLYVGRELGYFEEAGLDLNLLRMAGGAEILPGVGTGDIDIGFSNVVSLIAFHANRSPNFLVLTGGTYETIDDRNHALVTTEGWQRASSEGRVTVAVNTRNNIEELFARRYFQQSEVDGEQVQFRAVPFPAMQSALERGEVAIASLVEPFITRSTEAGHTLLATQYLEEPSDTVLVATYVVTRQWLDQNAKTAMAFRDAFQRATEFINDPLNQSEVRRIVAENTSMPTEVANQIGLPLMLGCLDLDELEEIIRLVSELMPHLIEDPASIPSAGDLVSADAGTCGA